MSPFGNFLSTGFNLRRTLFRRDAERSFFSGNPFPLPKIDKVSNENITKFKENYPFNFIQDKDDFGACQRTFRHLCDEAEVLHKARQIIEGKFDFPAKSEVLIGNPVKWNSDPFSGYEWPNTLAWKEDFFNFPEGADIINAWLPARLNQLVYLGKGYLVNADEVYVRDYKSLLKNFNDENPFCVGVNWTDVREVSIRLLNIILSIPFIIHSHDINDDFLNNFLGYILLHSIFIENNIQPDGQDYDYVIGLAALTASGTVLKDTYYGKKLLYLSSSKAEEAVRKVISPEGISRIRSIPHHPHVLEAFFIIRLALKKASIKLSLVFEDRYEKMYDVLASLLRDDDSVAQIGETFVKRILPFSDDEHKFPLAYGCLELNKGKFKSFVQEPPPDILFYFGTKGVNEYNAITKESYPRISYGYTRSGIFVLRNEDIHVTVDAEPVASTKKITGGHNDILSYELFYKGHKIISDPGMHSVYTDPLSRNTLISVKSHSTLYIDGLEPVEFEGLYGIKEDLTNPKVTEWHSDEYEDILSVQHYAYAGLSDPVIIKRIFRLLKEKNKLVIRSELFGGSTHQAFANIVLHPDVEVEQQENNIFKIISPVNGEIIISSPVSTVSSAIQENLYSPFYGRLETTRKIVFSITAQFPVYLTTEIQLK